MRKIVLLLLSALFAFIWTTGILQARPTKRYDKPTEMCRFIAEGELDWESEPWGLGGQKFRDVCKSCHTRDNDKDAPFLHAESMSSEGWNNVFAKRRKKCARDGSWDILTVEELAMINDYLYRNADNTYDPNDADSCG